MIVADGGIINDPSTVVQNDFIKPTFYLTIPPIFGASGAFTLVANKLYSHGIVITKTMTFDRIAIFVNTLSVGSVRLGIYADNGSVYPGTLILDAGTVDVSGTGTKSITINLTLTPGLYWLASVSDVVPILSTAGTAYTFAYGGTLPGVSGLCGYLSDLAFGTLPNPYTAGADANNTNPFVGLRKK